MPKIHRRRYLLVSVFILLFSFVVLPALIAQDDADDDETDAAAPAPIQFSGRVELLAMDSITVAGLEVDLSNANVTGADLSLGITVTVTGILVDGVVIAETIVIIVDPPEPTPLPESTAEVTPEPEMTPEATPEPEMTPEMTPEPTPVGDDDDDEELGPIIVIEGPVQEININTIVIFNIEIQVDPSDEILTQIQIGDIIRIEGVTSFDSDVIVIVAVNITIIEVNIIIIDSPGIILPPDVLPPNCRRKSSGKITCKNSSRRS